MAERILVAVAWPYANGSLHIGHAAGCYIPADIFARYHRLKGNEVLMVSGSDSHGTPVVIEAEKQRIAPEDIFNKYHAEFLDVWKRLGISFDLYTSTHTKNHERVAQDMFKKLLKKGYIVKGTMNQPYCEKDQRFLADRYVEGKCPHCGYDGARGDQCDNCGRTLDPQELVNMRCRLCGARPIIKETEHFFLRLGAFQDKLAEWIREQGHWRANVRNFSVSFVEGGLHDRAITRDLSWGVPIPVDGYDGKRLYVWFEAVIGYLSASVEWAKRGGNPSKWRDFWQKECRAYYFMGKDNIPFHTVIWPAMLMGYGDLNLPYDVVANEYLILEGRKQSKSRAWAVWLPDYLNRFAPDPLRYVISANMPETSDADFNWREYVRRNNDELVATYGNLVHRVATIAYRNFDKKVPQPVALDQQSTDLLEEADRRFKEVGAQLEACLFRAGLGAAMALAQSANKYIDSKAPWKSIKTDRDATATTLWVALTVVNALKVSLYPYLPFTSEKLHAMLGFDGSIKDAGWHWKPDLLRPGQELKEPQPLFVKLDEAVIEQENQKLAG
ncbi:MAG: methionine--tRNA ligase [SAR202 cluster bacterium]|nr:methionine--tRNA ligase [SAR202 cluster bacterium]